MDEKTQSFLRSHPPVKRFKDLSAFGMTAYDISKALAEGHLERAWDTMYIHPENAYALDSEYSDLLEISCKTPSARFILYTASLFHGLSNDILSKNYFLIPEKIRVPVYAEGRNHVIRTRNADEYGYEMECHDINGIPVWVTSPARTIVDLIRFSSLSSDKQLKKFSINIDEDVARQALVTYIAQGRSVNDLIKVSVEMNSNIKPLVQVAMDAIDHEIEETSDRITALR